jgi:site-specific recombinase XerD
LRFPVQISFASWLIDKGVDLERVRFRLGHGDLTPTTRYVILDEQDSTAADAIATTLGDVA